MYVYSTNTLTPVGSLNLPKPNPEPEASPPDLNILSKVNLNNVLKKILKKFLLKKFFLKKLS